MVCVYILTMNDHVAKIIKEMAKIDQSVRFRAKEEIKKSDELTSYNYLVYTVDAVHQFRLRKLIEIYGYPKKRFLGEDGLKSFWLLIQHQDFDLDLQKKCLKYCDFGPEEKAHLTDRVLITEGKEQKYGTQLNQPITNLDKVNKSRASIGLKLM